jgi:hypothetical protein
MLAADAVRKTAVEILTLINGSAYLQFVPYKAVRLGAVYGFYRERAPFITVEYSSGGTRLAWTREFPNESPNPRKWMELAYSNGDVAEALDIFGIQPESQRERRRNLYSIFEIIRKDVGTEKLIAKRGWASLHEIEECVVILILHDTPGLLAVRRRSK